MKKILMVDDNDHLREALPHILSMIEPDVFEFHTAKNGKEALEIILAQGNTNHFYALITDFNMPLMNGGELVRELLKREIFFPRIIVISGESDNEALIKDILISRPYIFFLKKPTEAMSIIELLKN